MESNFISTIKRLLWDGVSQDIIAKQLNVSQPTISRVKNGKIGFEVPWPNGVTGAMPDRVVEGVSSQSARYHSYPPIMQERILAAVNAERVADGLDPIPSTSGDLNSYLFAPLGDPQMETISAVRAAHSEDSRLALIMSEFDRILEEKVRDSAVSEYDNIVNSTHDDTSRAPALPVPFIPISYDAMPLEMVYQIGVSLPIIARIKASKDHLEQTALSIACLIHEDNPSFWATMAFSRLVKEIYTRISSEQIQAGVETIGEPDDN